MKIPLPVVPVRRYTVTHVNPQGMRRLSFSMQGRYTWATPEEAEEQLRLLLDFNSVDRLVSAYGPQAIGTFEVRPVSCYPGHFDPLGMWFD